MNWSLTQICFYFCKLGLTPNPNPYASSFAYFFLNEKSQIMMVNYKRRIEKYITGNGVEKRILSTLLQILVNQFPQLF